MSKHRFGFIGFAIGILVGSLPFADWPIWLGISAVAGFVMGMLEEKVY